MVTSFLPLPFLKITSTLTPFAIFWRPHFSLDKERVYPILCQLLSDLLLFSCHCMEVEMLLLPFWRKSEIFPKFTLRAYHCFITVIDRIVITSINSVSNLVETRKIYWEIIAWKISVSLYLLSMNQKFNLKHWNTTRIVKNIWHTNCSCWLEKIAGYILILNIEWNRFFSLQSSIAMATIKIYKGSF